MTITKIFNDELKQKTHGYNREAYQTYLTAPEWRNVDMAVEMAAFLKDSNPLYRYPYFQQIITFWYIFFQSLLAAHAEQSWFKLVFSEYTLMNVFIGVWTTLECLLKGIISIPFSLIGRRKNDTQLQAHVAKMHDEYQAFIHHTPFFLYSYTDKIVPMWKAYWHATDKSFADLITLVVTTVEFLIRGIPSYPARKMYAQPNSEQIQQSTEDQNTHVLVKASDQVMQNNFNTYKHSEVTIDPRELIEVSSKYYDLVLPRYVEFKNAIVALSETNPACKLKRIAGNKFVMVGFTAQPNDMDEIKQKFGANMLFSYSNSIDAKMFFTVKVKVSELLETVHASKADGAKFKLKHIHDF